MCMSLKRTAVYDDTRTNRRSKRTSIIVTTFDFIFNDVIMMVPCKFLLASLDDNTFGTPIKHIHISKHCPPFKMLQLLPA